MKSHLWALLKDVTFIFSKGGVSGSAEQIKAIEEHGVGSDGGWWVSLGFSYFETA